MASYAFEPGSSLGPQVRRVMRRQVKSAVRALAQEVNAASIHRARRCLKRCRSLLLLVRQPRGKRGWTSEAEILKTASDRLAGARDVQAKLDALSHIETTAGEAALVPAFARLRRSIDSNRRAHEQGIDLAMIERLGSELEVVVRRISRKRLRGFDDKVAMAGVAATYGKARRAMRKAYRSGADEDFHDWRKHVQRHWRHMQLFEAAWPDEIAVRIGAARQVSELLGDDHDLWMLVSDLEADKHRTAPGRRQRMIALGRDRQAELKARAHQIGAWLFAEKPAAFGRRLGVYWSAAAERAAVARTAADSDRVRDGKTGKRASRASKVATVEHSVT
ncbi:MAG: CHAD domain-containing protein [Hyphomicrobiaceae bacterium]